MPAFGSHLNPIRWVISLGNRWLSEGSSSYFRAMQLIKCQSWDVELRGLPRWHLPSTGPGCSRWLQPSWHRKCWILGHLEAQSIWKEVSPRPELLFPTAVNLHADRSFSSRQTISSLLAFSSPAIRTIWNLRCDLELERINFNLEAQKNPVSPST